MKIKAKKVYNYIQYRKHFYISLCIYRLYTCACMYVFICIYLYSERVSDMCVTDDICCHSTTEKKKKVSM